MPSLSDPDRKPREVKRHEPVAAGLQSFDDHVAARQGLLELPPQQAPGGPRRRDGGRGIGENPKASSALSARSICRNRPASMAVPYGTRLDRHADCGFCAFSRPRDSGEPPDIGLVESGLRQGRSNAMLLRGDQPGAVIAEVVEVRAVEDRFKALCVGDLRQLRIQRCLAVEAPVRGDSRDSWGRQVRRSR